MYIEGVVSYHFSDSTQPLPFAVPQQRTRHYVFHSFFLTTEKRILLPHLHTSNVLSNC